MADEIKAIESNQDLLQTPQVKEWIRLYVETLRCLQVFDELYALGDNEARFDQLVQAHKDVKAIYTRYCEQARIVKEMPAYQERARR